jgi:hypothetical protein
VRGASGPYISLDQGDSSVVNFEWRVFDSNIVLHLDCVVNETRVELKRLEPGKTVQETVLIKWPLTETEPPFLRRPFRKLERKNVKRLRFTVGYFAEEEGILDYLKRKPFGWFTKGIDSLEVGAFRGKRLYEVQKLVSLELDIPEIKK